MIRSSFILVLAITLLSSCSSKVPKPEPFFEHEEMVDFLSDISLAEGARQYARPEQRKKELEKLTIKDYYSIVFEKYEVTEAQFDSINAWYTQHPDEYNQIFKEVIDKLNKLMAEEKNHQKEEATLHKNKELKLDKTKVETGSEEEFEKGVLK